MSIEQSELRHAVTRNASARLTASRRVGQRAASLCHSHHDRDLAIGLQQRLREQGVDVYIDWQDKAMPAEPNRITAQRIQAVIKGCDLFLFLATANSAASRWCPWEIGYADGVKRLDQIAIVPTRDSSGHHHGNEYLQLYRRIDQPVPHGSWYVYGPGSVAGTAITGI
ncbi:MAG: toll/interleukin-1 receptor domain-containing protein [Mitsuaria chitosanitabida]|uniref:toll/interleukin-1 receptor domain-containing protein n=1 Tax=Roseateles chitosanitabidus TaxID=65048 RepID=UPI001B1A67FA|nr:toll/interleukin-1 receptor domain-containing protein [Roseateles chitosanitabidus]MBO9687079.1 toll/interleukin-1 receptor domain-containing protein [Roseateles chitosanitabidus]